MVLFGSGKQGWLRIAEIAVAVFFLILLALFECHEKSSGGLKPGQEKPVPPWPE